jgi:hypothetical protein
LVRSTASAVERDWRAAVDAGFYFFLDQGDLRIGVVPKSVCGF